MVTSSSLPVKRTMVLGFVVKATLSWCYVSVVYLYEVMGNIEQLTPQTLHQTFLQIQDLSQSMYVTLGQKFICYEHPFVHLRMKITVFMSESF
jgi:hypothetical protein